MLIGRTRSQGCILCRKRKIRCDQTKPSCRNCATYGQQCPGYKTTVPLIFRDENHKIEQLVLKEQTKPVKRKSTAAPNYRRPPRTTQQGHGHGVLTVPPFLLDSSWEHHSHCYFLDQFTLPTEPDGSPGPLDSIPLLYSLCEKRTARTASGPPHASLRAALDAAAFASLANQARVPALAVQARKKYGDALRELSRALQSVEDAVRNETLGAIVMLMLFEDINSERKSLMSTHVSGIQYLLKLRGPGQLEDPATRSLFHFAFTQMLIQFIGLNDPMRIDLDWLLEVLTIPHPIYNMMAGNIKISKFCATVAQTIQNDIFHPLDPYTLTSLLEHGEHLDLEFSKWHAGLPEIWLPRKTRSPTGEPIILYPDYTSAGVWNYYRGTRIVLQLAILQIHRCLETSTSGVVLSITSSEQLTSLPRTPEAIIVEMISEICESIPFCMGDLDIFGRPTPRSSYGKTSIKAIQGFALMWPLFSVPQSGHATKKQESQAREALQRVATVHGIRLGIDLSDETVQLDRNLSPHSSGASSWSDVS